MMSESQSQSPIKEQGPKNTALPGNKNIFCDVLHVEQIPAYWNFDRIQKFIRDITKNQKILDSILFIVIVKIDNLNSGAFLVKFKNYFTCKLAYDEWNILSKSRPMSIKYDIDNLYEKKKYFKRPFTLKHYNQSDEPAPKKQKFHENTSTTNEEEEHETYGLSPQFLNNLKIKIPFGNKLFVSNLHPDVTEAKLREVFGLAGQIVHVAILKKDFYDPPKYFAKLQYDHPVEAVQAISMFHNQQLFNKVLVVHMDSKPNFEIPEGLSDIGPGLGPNREPLRGIRNRIELQPLKQLLKKFTAGSKEEYAKQNTITPFAQQEFKSVASNSMMNVQLPIAQNVMQPTGIQAQIPVAVQAPTQQAINPFGTSGLVNPFNMSAIQNLQMNLQNLQNLNQQNPSNIQHAVSTLLQNNIKANVASQNQDIGNMSLEWQAKPMVGMQSETQPNFSAIENKNSSYGYNQSSNNGRSYSFSKCDDRDSRDKKSSRDEDKYQDRSDMLIFQNLPRSVTLQALRNKMQEVGELKFAEMTGQGRAIVRFMYTKDAEHCIKLFDRSKVDGQTIDVRYF